MVRRGEEIDECAQVFPGFPCRENAPAPLMDGSRMDASQRFPAVQVVQRNGQVPGVGVDVSGNPPPHDLAVLSPEVVVGDAHRWMKMPMKSLEGKWFRLRVMMVKSMG